LPKSSGKQFNNRECEASAVNKVAIPDSDSIRHSREGGNPEITSLVGSNAPSMELDSGTRPGMTKSIQDSVVGEHGHRSHRLNFRIIQCNSLFTAVV
jgi:hypothetical protein